MPDTLILDPSVEDDASEDPPRFDWAVNDLPDGVGSAEMSRLVAEDSGQLRPEMPFLNGFCLLLRREMLDQVGLFDEENFGRGYGEENDYALRARAAGWRLVLADDVFVYHGMSKSYSHAKRQELERAAGEIIAKKHGTPMLIAGEDYLKNRPVLRGIRARARHLVDRKQILDGGRSRFAGRRALFILPLAAAGGGASIAMFEMRAMRKMGIDVALFNLEVHREMFEAAYPDLDIPVIYGRRQDLVQLAPEWDAMVATMYTTVEWLDLVAKSDQSGTIFGYFVQDLEAYFYPVGSERFHEALPFLPADAAAAHLYHDALECRRASQAFRYRMPGGHARIRYGPIPTPQQRAG